MFYLISSNDPDHKFVILGGKVYIIGRRDCDILIPADASVSRKHAELSLSHTETNLTNVSKLPILRLKDISKFGTWVNGQRVEGERILQDGDSVYFGSQKSSFMVVYEPMVLTTSCLENALKKMVKQGLVTLGGHMVPEWQRDCSLLIMSKISVTIKVICALVSQKYIVSPQYIDAYVKHLQGSREKPDPSLFTPELAETQLDRRQVSFNPDSRRKKLFQGLTFYFLSPKQLKKMNLAIELAGGMPVLLEKGKIDRNIVKQGSLVMNCTDSELTQSSDCWVSDVQQMLTRYNKHMIADAEIGFAVLYCSTEKHCNPDYISDADISRLPSQSLSQVEPLVANTETPDRSQKEVKSQRKGARKETQTIVDETRYGEGTARATQMDQNTRTQTPRASQRGHITKAHTPRVIQTVQNTQSEKSQVVPVTKDEQHTSVHKHQHTSKKRNRVEEDSVPEGSVKRIKAEPITPSKSPKNQAKPPNSKDSKSSRPIAEDVEYVWDSDEELDYSKIETDISTKLTDSRMSPGHTRQTSPVPERTKQKKGQKIKSRSRSKSPVPPKSSSPVQDVVVKSEPISPSPKGRSKSEEKVQRSRDVPVDVKVESEVQSQTVRKQEVIDSEYTHSERAQDDQETVLLYDCKSGIGQSAVPPGFLTTRKPIKEQVQRNRDFEKDEDLPVGCVCVETISLIVPKPETKEIGAGDCPEGFTRWKGKVVRNFKKFKKTSHAGSQGLPKIIGGSDLQVHVAKRSKELDDWFRESIQAESQHTAEEKRAQELFNFDPSARRRGR